MRPGGPFFDFKKKKGKLMRTIYVLDQYTNGHEAALSFIRRQKWKKKECNIVFCGTHTKLLRNLAENPGYGVVPVMNTIRGEVTSVTSEISILRDNGYVFNTVDTLKLQIKHCLMVPKYFQSGQTLTRVISKPEALSQCDRWLKRHGITGAKRSVSDSTGAAARSISVLKDGASERIGAIAPRSAAIAYNLQILAENIADDSENTTTFHLLHNSGVPESCVVGIVGINGCFGQVLKQFFEGLGMTVIGSDRKNPTVLTNAMVVKKADVVIFAVAANHTVNAIEGVLRYTREDQLLMDITSVKQPAVRAMLKSKAQVVGLHPMFAPSVPFEGQTIVVCPERLTDSRWKTWVTKMLSSTGARCKWSTAQEHDKYMVTVQVGPQSANLVSAALITELGIPVTESLAFTSPFYRLMFSLMGRLLTQDPDLYGSIFMQNPDTVAMLRKRIKIEKELIRIIQTKDHGRFTKLFLKARNHFGSSNVSAANQLFMRFIAVTRTLEGKNSIVLQFSSKDNKPGLLQKILSVFRRFNVNLTGINFVSLDAERNQFSITTEGPRDSDGVMRAIRVIEKWVSPKMTILQ